MGVQLVLGSAPWLCQRRLCRTVRAVNCTTRSVAPASRNRTRPQLCRTQQQRPRLPVLASSATDKVEELQDRAKEQADEALDDFEDSLESHPPSEVLSGMVGVHK